MSVGKRTYGGGGGRGPRGRQGPPGPPAPAQPAPTFVSVPNGQGQIPPLGLAIIPSLSGSVVALQAGKRLRVELDVSAAIGFGGPDGVARLQVLVDNVVVGETGMSFTQLFAPSSAAFSAILALPFGNHTIDVWGYGNITLGGWASMDPANPGCHGSLTISQVD